MKKMNKNIIDLYWNSHTVAKKIHSSEADSIEFLNWRNSQYPLFTEFMQLDARHDKEKILDFGCGPGNDLVSFLTRSHAKTVIGIDISSTALLHAKKRISLHKNTETEIALINTSDNNPTIPLKNSSIDFIHCAGALHHTSKPNFILNEFYRILQDDGKCNIMVYNKNSIWYYLYVAYVKKVLENKFSDLNNDNAFSKLTDGEDCPISRCYEPNNFLRKCVSIGFKADYIGGYLSIHELKILSQYKNTALRDSRAPAESIQFLSQITYDSIGLPKFKGKYAGVGGVFRLHKDKKFLAKRNIRQNYNHFDEKYTPLKQDDKSTEITANRKINILILLNNETKNKNRSIIYDLINCFNELENSNIFIVNFYYSEIIPKNINYDIVIFHTLLLIRRYQLNIEDVIPEHESRYLAKINAVKIALPQDEHFKSNFLNDIINKYNISHVFSVSPPHLWRKIYNNVDPNKTKFYRVLTGYISDNTLQYINNISNERRDIDICYRSIKKDSNNLTRFWLGRHGNLKWQIAEIFSKCAIHAKLVTDISINQKDILLENKWYDLLLSSKYILGVEGGSSIHDPDGKIHSKTKNFLKLNPNASFIEAEKNCFPDLDDKFRYVAISPRHLEACATKTCQILIEGEYNNILQPWIHYIPLKDDFSNIIQVIQFIKSSSLRNRITSNAYNDVILSNSYTYEKFINFVVENSLNN